MEEVKRRRRRRRSSRKLPAKRGRESEALKSIRMPQTTFPYSQNSALKNQPHSKVSWAGVLGWVAEVMSRVRATFYELNSWLNCVRAVQCSLRDVWVGAVFKGRGNLWWHLQVDSESRREGGFGAGENLQILVSDLSVRERRF